MAGARLGCEMRWAAHRANPFFVLQLPPDATRTEIERQGAKLLAMLAANVEGARRCETPLGPLPRDVHAVRDALAELRDPARRLAHEWWARGLGWEGAAR
jgi:hypothetical protein